MLAGKELDQEKMLRQKMQKEQQDDYERVLKEEREKLSAVRMTYEKQIQELKRTHYKQCDELSKEVLKATLEADRLHNQLVGSPRRAKMFTSKSSKISLFRSLLFLVLVSVSVS